MSLIIEEEEKGAVEGVIEAVGEEETILKWVKSKRCPIRHCKTNSRITLTLANEHLKSQKLITLARLRHKRLLF